MAHLAEMDARRLYLREACASLFTYCTEVLHMSEPAAYNRIRAARAGRDFPVIFEMVAAGEVRLAGPKELAPHMTAENHRELLAAARPKSKREIEALLAARFPQPDVGSAIRKLQEARPAAPPAQAPQAEAPLLAPVEVAPEVRAAPASPAAPPPRPAVVAPLAAARYQVQFTASAELHAKLREAQALLRHQIPDGDVAQVMDRALTLLVETLRWRKHAETSQPRATRLSSETRRVPNAVKRAVWRRDGGQGMFVAPEGRRCRETGFLEFHHLEPYARGGPATVENLCLMCRAHNGHQAEADFGRAAMDAARRVAAGPP